MMLTIADCLCQNDRMWRNGWYETRQVWLVQLGIDPVEIGKRLGDKKPEAYLVGNEAMTNALD